MLRRDSGLLDHLQGVMGKEAEVGVGIPRGGKNKLGPLGEENLGRVSSQNFLE